MFAYFDRMGALVSSQTGRITQTFDQWMTAFWVRVNATYQVLGTVAGFGSSAQPATAFNVAALTAGVYRVSYAVQVTQAASVSSSISLTVRWTSRGVAMSSTTGALTGNTTTTETSGAWVLYVDAGTDVTWETGYASVGAPVMQYRTYLSLEQLP